MTVCTCIAFTNVKNCVFLMILSFQRPQHNYVQILDTDFFVFHVSAVDAQSVAFSFNDSASELLFLYHRLDLRNSIIDCRWFYRVSDHGKQRVS